MAREFDVKDLQECIHDSELIPEQTTVWQQGRRGVLGQILENQIQIMKALLKLLELKRFVP